MVKSVGVGPWGAGLSFGDSTLGFLAMWIGHAAAAGPAGTGPAYESLWSMDVKNVPSVSVEYHCSITVISLIYHGCLVTLGLWFGFPENKTRCSGVFVSRKSNVCHGAC